MSKNEFGAKSYEYAIGAIKATSHPPLTKEQFSRLEECERENFSKLLDEFGWAKGIEGDIPTRIEGEFDYAISFVKDISPDEALTDLLFFENDAENLKLFIKGKLIESDVSSLYDSKGTVPLEILRGSVKAWDFSLISDSVNEDLKDYENESDPFILSVAVDKAVYRDTLKKAEKKSRDLYEMLLKYGEAKNRIAEARLISLGIDKDSIKDLLLPVNHRSISDEAIEEVIKKEKEKISLLISDLSVGENFAPIAEYYFLKKEERGTLRRLYTQKGV